MISFHKLGTEKVAKTENPSGYADFDFDQKILLKLIINRKLRKA